MEAKEFVNPTPAALQSPDLKTIFRLDGKAGSFAIANLLLEKYRIKTIGNERVRDLFLYRDGIYIEGVNILKAEIEQILGELCTKHAIGEIIDKIKNRSLADREELQSPRNFLNFSNGVFNLDTKELSPHSPDHVFLTKLPVSYTSEADCPGIKKFLSEILDPEDIKIIQQWFGYVLYRKYFIKKAIIFVGEGNTGKTTLLRVLEAMIGRENISGVSLQRISQDKFSAAHFWNKMVNIYDDLAFKDVNDNGGFKIATGGGLITGEYKYGNQFVFENYAKLTFACNKVPEVEDSNDPAYFDRWIIIHFRKEVTKPDKFLIDRITSAEELSGLANWALEGLRELLATQSFSYLKDSHDIKIEMQRSGSPIAQFVQDCLTESVGEWIRKDDLHAAFIRYIRSKNMPPVTIEDFGRKLPQYADYIVTSKKTIDGKQVTGWRNGILKEQEEVIEEQHEIELESALEIKADQEHPDLFTESLYETR
jgi:P4 family phage/plasmid primase-like protien